jgi:hypothetical protein
MSFPPDHETGDQRYQKTMGIVGIVKPGLNQPTERGEVNQEQKGRNK